MSKREHTTWEQLRTREEAKRQMAEELFGFVATVDGPEKPDSPWEELRLFDIDSIPRDETRAKMREVEDWWMNQALHEAKVMVPRAVEYGAKDLELMGVGMNMMMPDVHEDVPHEELAIAFYVLGKVARLIGAYEEGHVPKDDTWDDLAIYARMAKYVREHGKWM